MVESKNDKSESDSSPQADYVPLYGDRMTVEIDAYTWALLRILVRFKAEKPKKGEVKPAGVPGRKLRHKPNRRTKDMAFLNDLCDVGLIQRIETIPEPADMVEARKPVNCRALFVITESGEHAAEYGEAHMNQSQARQFRSYGHKISAPKKSQEKPPRKGNKPGPKAKKDN